MFWRFGGYASISAIDSLLDKPDVSLEELLDESELIQELKQLNTKLIEYLREDDVLKKLMDYVISPSLVNEDDEDDDADRNDKDENMATEKDDTAEEEKKGDPLKDILDPEDLERAEKERLKRAYVACEILSSEVWSILDSTMANPEYLKDFWGFIRRPAPLDSIQASYFTKVNETLLDKKTSEMLDLLKSMDNIVPAILQHIDNPMVMDLLLKLISLERAEGGQGIVDWLKTQDLIPKLLNFLSSEWPASVQTSAGDFLKAIITISANATQNDQSCIGPNSLTRQLVSVSCVEMLVKAMLQGGNALTVGVGIVIEVIRKNNSDYDPEHLNSPDSMPSMYDPIYLGTLLRVFAKHIPDFVALIRSSKHTITDGGEVKSVERSQLSSAWGARIEPLGFDRFKTCELMAELLHCSNMGLLNEAGSDEYVAQRDAERERIIKEGAFGQHHEGTSMFDGNDSTADFVNGSVAGYGSPEDSRFSSHTGDEGFEDVSSSTFLVDKEKEASKEDKPEAEPSPAAQAPPTEPATAEAQETKDDEKKETSETVPSPTDELAAQISAVSLEASPASDANEKPAESSVSSEPVPASAPMASNPDAVPAPLFANKDQNQETTPASDASDQAKPDEPTDKEAEKGPAPETPGDVQQTLHPDVQRDTNGQPVVGDYLKIMFAENQVVPTILDFFFRFPWNNFLHNVVYDVIQQVFNGPMERGYNRILAIDVFETGKITQTIIDGQKRSDETQQAKRIRLGYMGHLTLIAEEVVKFSERHPPELLSPTVMENVLNPEWIDYVEQTLSETRERDNAILGGVRPDISIGHRQGMMGTGQSSALAEAGLNGIAGNSNFQGFDMVNQGSVSGGAFGTGGNSLLTGSGFTSSSDDDEDEDMEDLDDRHLAEQSAESGTENASSQPIPIIAPPPAPLSLGPSRARRQLAARLAAQKEAAENAERGENDDEKEGSSEFQWPSDSFGQGDQGHSSEFPPGDVSSPTFPESGFSPSDSFSNGSSDEGDDFGGSRRRKERVPLEVDDDDEMGEMVGPSMESHMLDSDDEEDAILNESLGYPELGPGQYKSFRSSRMGQSPFGDDQNDSSGEEDEGLVEILVPGKKSSDH